MPKMGWAPYSGVDDNAHSSDGGGRKGAGKGSPYTHHGGVDPKSATHGSGRAGNAKPGGRKKRSRNVSQPKRGRYSY